MRLDIVWLWLGMGATLNGGWLSWPCVGGLVREFITSDFIGIRLCWVGFGVILNDRMDVFRRWYVVVMGCGW